MKDSVDDVVEQWLLRLPSVEVGAAAALGRMHRISRIVQLRSEAILEEAGLTRGEFDVLAVLMRHERPLAPTEIATALSASPAGTTKRVQKLLAAGLLTRKPHESDRRSALLHLTPRARQEIPLLLEAITGMEREVLAVLPPDAASQLNDTLKVLLVELETQDSSSTEKVLRVGFTGAEM